MLPTEPTLAYGEIRCLLLSTFEQSLASQPEGEARARTGRFDDPWSALNAVLGNQTPVFEAR